MRIRTGRGLSAYQAAKNADTYISAIRAVERGTSNYTVDTLLNYLDAVGVRIEFRKDGRQ